MLLHAPPGATAEVTAVGASSCVPTNARQATSSPASMSTADATPRGNRHEGQRGTASADTAAVAAAATNAPQAAIDERRVYTPTGPDGTGRRTAGTGASTRALGAAAIPTWAEPPGRAKLLQGARPRLVPVPPATRRRRAQRTPGRRDAFAAVAFAVARASGVGRRRR